MIVVTVVEVTITLTVLVGGRLCGGDKTRLIRYDFKENQTTDNAPTTTLCLSALLQMYQKTFNFQLSTFLWMGGGGPSLTQKIFFIGLKSVLRILKGQN